MRRVLFLAIGLMATTSMSALATDRVEYGAPPRWVEAALPLPEPTRQQGALAILTRDVQVRIDDQGMHSYEDSHLLVQTAEGLPAGNLGIVWNPAAGGPVVHAAEIIRDGELIDVLRNQRFAIFQREGGLEQSVIDGMLTASLQIPGLRVGDIVHFQVTTNSDDPTFRGISYGAMALPPIASTGSYRMTLTWTDGNAPQWISTPDIADQLQRTANGLSLRLDQPGQLFLPENAPLRASLGRMLEFSEFANWQDVSRRLYPLYQQAAVIPRRSELRDDVERIMRRYPTQAERARAALRLVQDQIRYVYVGMNGGNLTPASVEETWERRYGDCKAKTVLLLALLQEMGIAAEPVVVNLGTLGDAIETLTPNPGQFDHVLVRATIDGEVLWLDGTRQGDSRLNPLPPEPFSHVLAVRQQGADLESLPWTAPELPQELTLVTTDASAGIDQPVHTSVRRIMRGSEALQYRAALQSLTPDQLDQVLRQMAGGESAWQEILHVGWSFDEDRAALVLDASGIDLFDWSEADNYAITGFAVVGAGFNPPAQRRRPPQQDRSKPYTNDPFRFSCHVTTVRLPATSGSQGWQHNADAMNVEIGGVAYWRMADLSDGEMRTVMSSRTVRREITAEEAEAANAMIPGFDNAQSWVYLRRRGTQDSQRQIAADGIDHVPSTGDVDWLADASACLAPQG